MDIRANFKSLDDWAQKINHGIVEPIMAYKPAAAYIEPRDDKSPDGHPRVALTAPSSQAAAAMGLTALEPIKSKAGLYPAQGHGNCSLGNA